jgi:hypothetical protein
MRDHLFMDLPEPKAYVFQCTHAPQGIKALSGVHLTPNVTVSELKDQVIYATLHRAQAWHLHMTFVDRKDYS